ncbi:hypothetical protein F5Y10DRAFT_250508 [Nemania abortiva]|nr:hypothetical protein F5Y10DRAFT_250508 [Nemania abortiva]
MRNAVSDKLAERGQRELLEQYLTWTIIEDPVAESASAQAASSPTNAGRKKEYRQRFDQWCRGRSIERDGRGAEHPATGHLPRFNFCVLVDDTCLETFRKWEHWVEAGRQGQEPIVAMILLDANCDQYGNGRMNFPVVEGCTREYTGWMYADVRSIPGLYDKLHYGGLTDGPGDYARPPLVYPGHQHGARIS